VRALSHPGFQRWSALVLSALGLLSAAPIAWGLVAAMGRGRPPRLSSLAYGASLASQWMIAAMVLVGACLGLYLALRGHRRSLTRLLALSCGALSAGFGLFFALRIVLDTFGDKLITTSAAFSMMTYSLLVIFPVVVFLMSAWLYSTANFLLQFPKPVKLLGEEAADVGAPARHSRFTFDWRWLTSPQFAALMAGIVLIVLVNRPDHLFSASWTHGASYFVCWVPFAIIGAKQRLLDEEGRRAIRWVLLGQTAWLVLFLASMLVFLALKAGGVLVFENWNHSWVFTDGLLKFFFAGFVIVLMATLGFSILYNGTLDPDLMLRRTWVLAAVGLFSGVLFVVIERLIAGVIADRLGISAVNALTIVGAVTAAVVYPARSWLERKVRELMEGWQAAHAIADGVRRDAAIVFADLSGYTALTERNEREALIMAALFHRDAQQVAKSHGGVLVKTIGDAVMLRFEDSAEALAATNELKRAFRAHVEAMSMQPLPIHAAIHRGEVVEAPSGDVFGATVNLAARLLGAAGPDDIVASQAAVARMPGHQAQSLGERKFKNVEMPVECFRLAT
jgi:class 3 adenylate cyclase